MLEKLFKNGNKTHNICLFCIQNESSLEIQGNNFFVVICYIIKLWHSILNRKLMTIECFLFLFHESMKIAYNLVTEISEQIYEKYLLIRLKTESPILIDQKSIFFTLLHFIHFSLDSTMLNLFDTT